MATYIQSEPSMGGTTLPTNAGELIRGDEWGIDNTLADCIIQSESITETVTSDDTQDQKGALVSQLDYDKRWDLSLTILCDSAKAPVTGDSSAFSVGDTTFAYAGHKWKLTSIQYTGSYNAKKQYSLTGFRTVNFPAQA